MPQKIYINQGKNFTGGHDRHGRRCPSIWPSPLLKIVCPSASVAFVACILHLCSLVCVFSPQTAVQCEKVGAA